MRSGKALGNIFLTLTTLALVAFVLRATLGCSCSEDPSDPSQPVETADGGIPVPSETVDTGPKGPQIDDVDEPLGVFDYTLPVLAFKEHSAGLPETGTWLGYPTLADLDGDKDYDLVASNREEDGVSVWRFDPAKPWEVCNEGLPRDMSYGPTAVADIDGDKDEDLLIGDHTQALRAFLNDGDMNWTESPKEWDKPFILKDMAVADLNGTGNFEVATISHFKGGLTVYEGDGEGGFSLTHTDIVDPRVFGQKLILADLDGDDIHDIAADTNEGLLVFLTRRTETGLDWEEVSTGLPAPAIGNSLFGLTAANFDEDRKGPQLAVCSVPDPGMDTGDMNAIGVYALEQSPSMDSRAWVQIDKGLPRSDRYKDVVAADFNQDGHWDLIVANLEEGRAIYLGDGTGSFTPKGRIVGHSKCRFTVADINNDGYPDVMTATSGQKGKQITGKLRVFLNDPSLWTE
jgi:hypothetical protein